MTVKQVEQRLGCGRRTVYELRQKGELKVVRIGKAVRFRPEDVEAFIDRHTEQ